MKEMFPSEIVNVVSNNMIRNIIENNVDNSETPIGGDFRVISKSIIDRSILVDGESATVNDDKLTSTLTNISVFVENIDAHANSATISNNKLASTSGNVSLSSYASSSTSVYIRSRHPDLSKRERNVRSDNRVAGKPYVNRKGVLVPKKLPEDIDCKCKFQCGTMIPYELRKLL
ncbi:uncharacterized protein LOC124817996 [Hydra vulgaris]|uniref:uncharacterized protein LOC124817996 n=1 Tax=Hydra vulgaris TaxID=6087 RepID=UPI001F5FD275|nr:uncharacterized protein LOC124817996 [Hydra vulgaris]XP_047144449.1 uncharacterized protein LOC124817996 [Hydra vulgaris]